MQPGLHVLGARAPVSGPVRSRLLCPKSCCHPLQLMPSNLTPGFAEHKPLSHTVPISRERVMADVSWQWAITPPPPVVQRTINSSKNAVRTAVFIGHAVQLIQYLVPN